MFDLRGCGRFVPPVGDDRSAMEAVVSESKVASGNSGIGQPALLSWIIELIDSLERKRLRTSFASSSTAPSMVVIDSLNSSFCCLTSHAKRLRSVLVPVRAIKSMKVFYFLKKR